ncbi:MAG: right-handed parallel beta-helix repeat-containing protein [Phycisphaerales bacterium]|nr:right-handed parallel beta-helix repeat-containing protein [Phycisphaerales bacterium]
MSGTTRGAVYCNESSPLITDCIFKDNRQTTSAGSPQGGAAVHCINSANPIISHCDFVANSTESLFPAPYYGQGGAIYCGTQSSPAITSCRFVDNLASHQGGAIYLNGSNCLISQSQFLLNTCFAAQPINTPQGGAIFCQSASPHISNCVFGMEFAGLSYGNTARQGSAIYVSFSNSKPVIANCTITSNDNVSVAGDAALFIVGSSGSQATVTHSILWGNDVEISGSAVVSWSDVEGGFAGTGNFSSDPVFVERDSGEPDELDDPFDGGFYLSNQSAGEPVDSPCVDAGDPGQTAEEAGYVHLTTRTDLAVEDGASLLDIGYHVASDCNGNGEWDSRDIALSSVVLLGDPPAAVEALDCNHNQIPDMCEGSGNYVPNSCECLPAKVAFTTNDDFDRGVLINLHHDTSGQIARYQYPKPLPYLWLPLSGRSSVARVYTGTDTAIGAVGTILSEHRTAPAGFAGNPSRTGVDLDGNLWIANRNDIFNNGGSVVRIGMVIGGTRVNTLGYPDPNGALLRPPFLYNTCIDKDGDGMIRTSREFNDVLAWPSANPPNAGDADDECICKIYGVNGIGVRHVAIDKSGGVWVGGRDNHAFDYISSALDALDPTMSFDVDEGGYGGFVDCNNVMWTVWRDGFAAGRLVRFSSLPPGPVQYSHLTDAPDNFGLALDRNGNVWTSQWDNDEARLFNAAGVYQDPPGAIGTGGQTTDRGVVVTPSDNNLWISNSEGGSTPSVSRMPNGGGTPTVYNIGDDGGTPTGLTVDQDGYVWVTCQTGNTLKRIDPADPNPGDPADGILTVSLPANTNPYSFTDQTGNLTLLATGMGTWTVVHDSEMANTPEWHMIRWNTGTCSNPLPGGIGVSVRAADTRAGLPGVPYTAVENMRRFDAVAGRYLEIRVRLAGSCPGAFQSPVLCDLEVWHGIGDMNCSGTVNNFDIDAFVQALADPSAYEAAHPDCDRMLADIDGNGLVNNFDTDPFVELLANSCYGAE